MAQLSRINIFPIKSFDGYDLSAANVLPTGALQLDRRYALVDSLGRFVNGKRFGAIHKIRANYSEDLLQVTLECAGEEETFSLSEDQELLARWCGERLDSNCRLEENTEFGFPDDVESPGPTLISTASLETVAQWFSLDLAEVRRRMRFNLEVADVPPFWEDGLVPALRKARRFKVGEVVWQGRGVCQRCTVPTRDSRDGTTQRSFAREFARLREESLPEWAPSDRFDHFYRFGVNTALESLDGGSEIRVGDQVELCS